MNAVNLPTRLFPVGDTTGCLFESDLENTFCFVPVSCLRELAGVVTVDLPEYFRSRWHERNAAFNLEAHRTLLPRSDGLLGEPLASPALAYLQRLQRIFGSLACPAGDDAPAPLSR